MLLPFTSLSGATSTGPGASAGSDELLSQMSCQVIAAGGANWEVDVEISLDGANWFLAEQIQSVNYPPGTDALVGFTPPLAKYVRANLVTLTGGSSPAITALICGLSPA